MKFKIDLRMLNIVLFVGFIVMVFLAVASAHAAPEQIQILGVQTRQTVVCRAVQTQPPSPTFGGGVATTSPVPSKRCTQEPIYDVSYKRNNGTQGVMQMKSYPFGKYTTVNFCGDVPCEGR
jgi:hypothetical protein